MKTTLMAIALATTAFTAAAAQTPTLDIPPPEPVARASATAAPGRGAGPTFDAVRFGKKLDAALDAATASYAWSITQGGKLVASGQDGYARTPADGNILHGPNQRQNIASVSKTITTVVILQLLRRMGKDEDTKIATYLPPGWKAGPNVDKLTFAHLLNHRSAFPVPNNNSEGILGYEAMRAMVLAGTSNAPPFPAPPANIDYRNVNFALLRVLTSQMYAQLYAQTKQKPEELAIAMQPQLGKLPPIQDFQTYLRQLNNYVYTGLAQKYVFNPIGVKGALCEDKTPKATLYYDQAQTIKGERSMGNNSWTNFCGSGGWYLSSNDLVKFMTYLRNTEVLLPKPWRDKMVAERFGLYRSIGEHGDYFFHSGVVGSGDKGGIYACLMRFSINVEAAVVINSVLPAGMKPCDVVRQTFDAAWQ